MTKTLSFACVHFTVAFTVGYLLTGSIAVGGTVALVEPLCNTFAYHLHEKVWAWLGRRNGTGGGTDGDGGDAGSGGAPGGSSGHACGLFHA
ncbi:putative membrane protein [Azospirillum fermentarium]|uniref:DUF2061 domain-containing protein n=1 Tax=Azospirillum fermentarium TaxID=1233114 RepID=UPI002227C340|nr:DUF2061 domain-containing protein [Azospirillum fermentarium]MCW2246200.1 putative membrane protein [Azospirillum fermentarium]